MVKSINMGKAELLQRVIKMENGTELTIPDANMDVDEAVEMFANQYPELTTAKIGKPTTTENKIIYPVEKQIGTKG